jgi:tRNA 2-thiocytidine biosynthesis protein TtcA
VAADRLERLEKRIAHRMGRAIVEWRLIEEGDRILVAVSGGKDSTSLLRLLRRFRSRAPVRFDLVAVHLDAGRPGSIADAVAAHLAGEEVPFRIVRKDIWSLIEEKLPEGETPCAICSRYRRGILYNQAVELGCTKIALGHHRDDAIETLLLNLFFEGRLKSMPARLESDDGRNTVIRPLIYVPEEEIREYATLSGLPALGCDGCGGTERDGMERLLDQLSARIPQVRGNILAALRNVSWSHLLDSSLAEALRDREKAPASPPETEGS